MKKKWVDLGYRICKICFYISLILIVINFFFQESAITMDSYNLALFIGLFITTNSFFENKFKLWQASLIYFTIILPIDWFLRWCNLETLRISYSTFLWVLACEGILVGIFFLMQRLLQKKESV